MEPESIEAINKYKVIIKSIKHELKANITFKTAGPRECFRFYSDIQKADFTEILYIILEQKRFIMEDQKVKIEKRYILIIPTNQKMMINSNIRIKKVYMKNIS